MPENNWVKQRAECSIVQMFNRLKLEIQGDIETRNKCLSGNAGYTFSMVGVAPNKFSVLRDHGPGPGMYANRSVIFECAKSEIKISDDLDQMAELFSATITFNDVGQCVFKVADQERESWQVRKRALENLFFEFGS